MLAVLLSLLLQCGPTRDVLHEEMLLTTETPTLAPSSAVPRKEVVAPVRRIPERSDSSVPNHCEGLVAVQVTRDGRTRTVHRRDRYVRTKEDRRRTKDLIRLVASEMGVRHPDFFVDVAMHESTLNPEAIHILNPDEEANQRAWSRHTYTRAKERMLEAAISRSSARERPHYEAKRRLAAIRRYKDNPYWYDDLVFPFVVDGGATDTTDRRSVWSFGYSLYGHNAVLYMPYWDSDAAPWVLCSHEGIVATIIEVWAARKAAATCASLTSKDAERWGRDGGSYRGALRRLARGHCGNERLGAAWRKIMEKSSVPWGDHADFGQKFSRKTSDPNEVLDHMLARAREEGVLRETPLQRRGTYRASVVIHRERHGASG